MNHPNFQDSTTFHRVPGEDLPRLLSLGLALLGVMLAFEAGSHPIWSMAEETHPAMESNSSSKPAPQVILAKGSMLAPTFTPVISPTPPPPTSLPEVDPTLPPTPLPGAGAQVPSSQAGEGGQGHEHEVEASQADPPPLFTVSFGLQQVEAGAERHGQIEALVGWMARHPNAMLLVDGHSDAVGSVRWNLEISRQRAESVGRQLIQAGLPQERMTVRAFGPYSPLPGLQPDAVENRRVTLSLLNEPGHDVVTQERSHP